MTLGPHVPDDGWMAMRRRSSRLMMPKTPRFWSEMKTGVGFARRGRNIPVDIGPLDRTARECHGPVDDVAQGVTVVRGAGQRAGMQHEQDNNALSDAFLAFQFPLHPWLINVRRQGVIDRELEPNHLFRFLRLDALSRTPNRRIPSYRQSD